jgi:hypothetical protein
MGTRNESMTKVAILPEPGIGGETAYRAIAGQRQSVGKTAGEALDALAAQLPADESGTLVIVQHLYPDRLFTAEQQHRFSELMDRWRNARDLGRSLSDEEKRELDILIDAEVRASAERARDLLRKLKQ